MPEESSEIPESYLPTNVHLLHKEKREKIFHQTMDKILDKILLRFWASSTLNLYDILTYKIPLFKF